MVFNKFEIEYNSVRHDLINGSFRMNSNVTKFEHSKQYSSVNLSNSSSIKEIDTFTPVEMTFETIRDFIDVSQLQNFLRNFDQVFTFYITVGAIEFTFYGVLDSDSIDPLFSTDLEKFTFKIVRTSHFFKYTSYVLDNSIPTTGSQEYDYTYDFEYGGSPNNFSSSTLTVYNYGDKTAPTKIRIIGNATNPAIGVNADATSTYESYRATTNCNASEYIENSSYSGDLHIAKISGTSTTNIEQNRVFSGSRGYIYIPLGTTTLFFTNVTTCQIDIAEVYVNIRGN